MSRHDAPQIEVVPGALQVQVGNVAALVRSYARLGLRIIRQSPDRAMIALPCGVILVLSRVSLRRANAAA
jgi:hypothetical protein